MNTYCLPIQKSTQAEVLSAIATHSDAYGYFEVWIDLIEDIDAAFLDSLITRLDSKLIIVFRRPHLEPMQLPLATRLQFLQQLHRSGIYVDLDIQSQNEELEYIAKNQLSIQSILSYHDYQHTPPDHTLYALVERMREDYQPTIVKLATMCQSREDALRLLQLLLFLREKQQRAIILGMGEHGLITRVFGPLWGNELSFVPEDASSASAPGQLTRCQLENIMQEIRR